MKSSETEVNPESKQQTVGHTPENDERGPSNSDQQLARSNEEIFALLRAMRDDICDLRKEIHILRNHLAPNSGNKTIYTTIDTHYAADLEHNDSDWCQDVEMKQPRRTIIREQTTSEQKKKASISPPPHAKYLEECFRSIIGLELNL